MRIIRTCLLASVIIFVSACTTVTGTSTDFARWSGSGTYVGSGGLLDEYDGVEFWRSGAPEAEFYIVGMITQNKSANTMHDAMFGGVNRREILNIVKSNNADGVIKTDSQRYISGYTTTVPQSMPSSANTRANIREESSMFVFKYVE